MNLRRPMVVSYSFAIENKFYDGIDVSRFYFDEANFR